MFNRVHHYCYLFTDFYKKFLYVEFKPFFMVRKIRQFYFLESCLLVIPFGFDPCFNVT